MITVDVFVFGKYQGRIDVSKDSLVGKLALREYDAIPVKVKELCRNNLSVALVEPEVVNE